MWWRIPSFVARWTIDTLVYGKTYIKRWRSRGRFGCPGASMDDRSTDDFNAVANRRKNGYPEIERMIIPRKECFFLFSQFVNHDFHVRFTVTHMRIMSCVMCFNIYDILFTKCGLPIIYDWWTAIFSMVDDLWFMVDRSYSHTLPNHERASYKR